MAEIALFWLYNTKSPGEISAPSHLFITIYSKGWGERQSIMMMYKLPQLQMLASALWHRLMLVTSDVSKNVT